MTAPAESVHESVPAETLDARYCTSCRSAMNRLGAQPVRTGGLPGHPDAVLWLDTHWCPRCGRVEFFTARGPDESIPETAPSG